MLLTSIFEIYAEVGRKKSRLKILHKVLDTIAHYPSEDKVRHIKLQRLKEKGFKVEKDAHLCKLLKVIGFGEETKLSKSYPFVNENYLNFDMEIGSDR